MEYGFLLLLVLFGVLIYIGISKLKEQVKLQQKQIDALCKATGNQQLSINFVSDEVRQAVITLKNSGKEVEAIKRVREVTSMDILEAKQYVSEL